MHLPGDGHMSVWNIEEVYGVYNKYTCIYLCAFVGLVSYLIAQRMIMDHAELLLS